MNPLLTALLQAYLPQQGVNPALLTGQEGLLAGNFQGLLQPGLLATDDIGAALPQTNGSATHEDAGLLQQNLLLTIDGGDTISLPFHQIATFVDPSTVQIIQPSENAGIGKNDGIVAPVTPEAIIAYSPEAGIKNTPESDVIGNIIAKIPNAGVAIDAPEPSETENNQTISSFLPLTALGVASEQASLINKAATNTANSLEFSKKPEFVNNTTLVLDDSYESPVKTKLEIAAGRYAANNNNANGDEAGNDDLNIFSVMTHSKIPQTLGDATLKTSSIPQPDALTAGIQNNSNMEKAATPLQTLTLPLKHTEHSSAAEQVRFHISNALKNGDTSITVKLEPAELGRVDIRLDIARDGVVRAAIVADRADTLDMLNKDSRVLERVFQDSGLKMDAGQMQFSLRGENGSSQEAYKQSGELQNYNTNVVAQEEDEDIPAQVVYLNSGYGLVDIHV